MVPPSSKDEALAHYSVSREVPCSVLKCETLLQPLMPPQKFLTRLSHSRRAPKHITFQSHTVGQTLPRVEAKESALPSSRDLYLLESTEWPQGSQASSSVWRGDSGLLSRPCRKRRPSSRDDGGVLWVFSSCVASLGFLTRYDGELREPLVWCQGSQASMRMARGSASLLLRHGRGLGPQDALGISRFSRVTAGNPGFPRLLPVTSGSFSGCL